MVPASVILDPDARPIPSRSGPAVSADFNWWLLIVGLVAGGALTWLVIADSNRRDAELSETEIAAEAGWIARSLDEPLLDAEIAERVLRAHRRYLGFPPPDLLVEPGELTRLEDRHAAAGDPDQAAPA
jgi:hypothetical protein